MEHRPANVEAGGRAGECAREGHGQLLLQVFSRTRVLQAGSEWTARPWWSTEVVRAAAAVRTSTGM